MYYCQGKRLRKETNYVKIDNKSISDLVELPIKNLIVFFETLSLNEHDLQIAKRLLEGNQNPTGFLG